MYDLCKEGTRDVLHSKWLKRPPPVPRECVGTLQHYSLLCRKAFEVCAPVTSGSHTRPCRNLNRSFWNQTWWWEGEEQNIGRRSKKSMLSLLLSHAQTGKRWLWNMLNPCVLSFLLAAGLPAPPLTVCRQQFMSGPGMSCKRKWEEIWSIWWHYKAHCWFASFIKTRSRIHHLSWLASSAHTRSLHFKIFPLSSAAPVLCLTTAATFKIDSSLGGKLISMWRSDWFIQTSYGPLY